MSNETRTDFLALHPEGCVCESHVKLAELIEQRQKLNRQMTADATAEMVVEFEETWAKLNEVQRKIDDLRYSSE